MAKVRALNRNGEITWCTAKTPGHGNCNHVLHQTGDMTERKFQKQVESDTKTDKKDDLESLSTDELASLLRGEMNDLGISLKQDMPELNKSLDINNYRPKE